MPVRSRNPIQVVDQRFGRSRRNSNWKLRALYQLALIYLLDLRSSPPQTHTRSSNNTNNSTHQQSTMPLRAHSLPPRAVASSPAGLAPIGSSLASGGFANRLPSLPEDFNMDLGGLSPHPTVLPVHDTAGMAMVNPPPARPHHNPFHLGDFANPLSHLQNTSNNYGGPDPGPPAIAPLSYRAALMGVAPPVSHSAPPVSHPVPQPIHPVPPPQEVPAASLTPAEVEALKGMAARADAPKRAPPPPKAPEAPFTPGEVKALKGMTARVDALERELRDVSLALLSSSRSYRQLQDETTDIYDAIRVAPLYGRPTKRATRDESPVRNDFRPSRADRRHRPYDDRGRDSPRPGRNGAGSRRDASPARRGLDPPPRPSAPRAPAATRPPLDEDVDMEPVGVATDHGPAPSASAPARPLVVSAPRTRSGKRVLVAAADYRVLDPRTGVHHPIAISRTGLPLFQGVVAAAFTALQGPAETPDELTRRIWLLYQGRVHLPVWDDAVKATRRIRKKVALPPPLQLLLDLHDLPINQWEHIMELWSTVANPLSAITPGIRHNPNGFAGLDNFDIETADYFNVWTSGNPKAISKICNRETHRTDVKDAFRVVLSSPNLWQLEPSELSAGSLSPLLLRLRYVDRLEPELIADWLRNKVGLTAYDVVARFAPFAYRSFDIDALNNPRASHTTLVPGEVPPVVTDDSLPDFGEHLDWTPARGPRGPNILPRVADTRAAAPSEGPAHASSSQ